MTTYYWQASTSSINRRATLYWTSGVYYKYTVRNQADGVVAKSGHVWIDNGGNTFTVDNLSPAKYDVQFVAQSYGWSSASSYCLITPNENMQSQVNSYDVET